MDKPVTSGCCASQTTIANAITAGASVGIHDDVLASWEFSQFLYVLAELLIIVWQRMVRLTDLKTTWSMQYWSPAHLWIKILAKSFAIANSVLRIDKRKFIVVLECVQTTLNQFNMPTSFSCQSMPFRACDSLFQMERYQLFILVLHVKIFLFHSM